MATEIEPEIEEIAFANAFGFLAEELDAFTEGAKVGVMATLMAAFSAYLGPHVRVETGRGTSPLATWFVLIGKSGIGRKGATARISMPVINKAFPAFARHNVISGIPATGLGLMTTLNEHGGNPVFVLEEEGDTFISNAKRDVKVGVYLRKGWDGEAIAHKTAKADFVVEEPHFGFVMHVQPKNWGAISGSKDATGGTFNRFLAILVRKSKDVPVFNGPDSTETVATVAKLLKEMGIWAASRETVKVPNDVAEVFEAYHRPLCEALTEDNETLSEMAERSLAYLIRVAALYALGDGRDEVSVEDLDSALALVRYAVASVRHVLPNTGDAPLHEKILEALEGNFDPVTLELVPMTMTELWDYIGRNTKRAAIMAALKKLPQVEVFKGASTGGRPPIMLRLVDLDHEPGTEDDERELVAA